MQNKKQTTKQNKVQTTNKGDKTMKKTNNTQTQTQTQKATLVEQVITKIANAQKADTNVRIQKVTGYISVKYANSVLFELHAKKKAISHLTFSTQQKVFEILKANKLILRVVPASYGWKYNTECLLTDEFFKHFDAILKSVIEDAIAKNNAKNKQQDKKVAKA